MENKCHKHGILNREGLKNTRHRKAILEILQNSDDPVTADDIYIKMKETNTPISLSTVYRTLEALASKNLIIKATIMNDGKARYELNDMQHKHHMICVGCKKMIAIENCPFSELEEKLREDTDFDVTGHRFEIYGYCPKCKKN